MYRPLLVCLSIFCSLTMAVHGHALIQNPDARNQQSLNGDWHIIVDPYENGFYNHRYEEKPNGYFKDAKMQHPSDLIEYNFSASPTLRVPGDWNSQKESLFFYEGTIWYRKAFESKKQNGKRYILYFDAVNYEAIVYLNGEKLGRHEGGFTAFQFDATKALKKGMNTLVVKVNNRRERDFIPTVNTDWWNYGGITRPVRLLEVPQDYLADYTVKLQNDKIAFHAVSSSQKKNQTIRLHIPELGINEKYSTDGEGKVTAILKAKPELWTPENPKRYSLTVSLNGEKIKDNIGFRDIAIRNGDILLNGKPVFLKGISIHEEAPTREGRAWTEEDARTTLTWAKELGCNFIRLAHYPHNEAMLKVADEMGLLVWSEIPVYWTVLFEREDVYAKAEQQLEEMIERDKNRASIILWSVANETPNHQVRLAFLKKLVKKARQLDNSRLITAAMDTQTDNGGSKIIDDPLAGEVDVIGVNSYCGWYGGTPQSCASLHWLSPYNKPVIISEFGGGALKGLHGEVNERWTEEYQAAVYEHNLTMISKMDFVRGTTPWILKDFRSPRRPLPVIQDYWNRKGVLSEKGERKLAWKILHDFYENLTSSE